MATTWLLPWLFGVISGAGLLLLVSLAVWAGVWPHVRRDISEPYRGAIPGRPGWLPRCQYGEDDPCANPAAYEVWFGMSRGAGGAVAEPGYFCVLCVGEMTRYPNVLEVRKLETGGSDGDYLRVERRGGDV